MEQSAHPFNPQSVTPQRPKSSMLLVLIVVVALVGAVLGSVGTYILMSSRQNIAYQLPIDPTPTVYVDIAQKSPATKEQPFENAPAGYKTYSANKFTSRYGAAYQFSVYYPDDWKPRDHDYGTGANIAFLSPDYKDEAGAGEPILNGARIEIVVYSNRDTPTLEEWVEKNFYNPVTKKIYVTPKKHSINNLEILEFDWQLKDTGQIDQITPEVRHTKVFTIGQSVYQFQILAQQKSEKNIALLENMIASFTSPN